MREIAPGLFHWTAPHPGWDPEGEPGSPADWPEQVGCTLYGNVFIDPQVPDCLWPALDAVVARREVVVLTTIRFHGRTRNAVLERYGGTEELPDGVEAFPIEGFGETIYWLPEPRALVPGDLLIGDGDGGIRMCPESWLRGYLPEEDARVAELRKRLRPLLELPVEHVLASHWSPVIGGGHAALERALA
jgi:hypothetical protein